MKHKKALVIIIVIAVLFSSFYFVQVPVSLENHFERYLYNQYGESLLVNIDTTASKIFPLYSYLFGQTASWLYNSQKVTYVKVDVSISISAQNVEDTFYVTCVATAKGNNHQKVLINVDNQSRTGLADGSESFTYTSGNYDVSTLLEVDLAYPQSGSPTVDFYVQVSITTIGAISKQKLTATIPETLFQSMTFSWQPDTVYYTFSLYNTYGLDTSISDPTSDFNSKTNSEDGVQYLAYGRYDVELYMNTYVQESNVQSAILYIKWKASYDSIYTASQSSLTRGLCIYDWQAGSWLRLYGDTPPSTLTKQSFDILQYTLDFIDTTGEVRVLLDYRGYKMYFYIDYMALEITPATASWVSYMYAGGIPAVIGIAIALIAWRKQIDMKKMIAIAFVIGILIAVVML